MSIRFRDKDGAEAEASMTKRLVTIPTVSETRVLDLDGTKVGYVLFRNFVEPSVAALDAAFEQLRAEGATELVLDLRYNGGGLVSVGQHLGGLVGGAPTAEQTFVRFVHNDKNSFRDMSLLFPSLAASLGLSRVVVITTRSSASASEMVINSLRPFMGVTVVGDSTFGKPVGQYGFRFCGKILFPVAFTGAQRPRRGRLLRRDPRRLRRPRRPGARAGRRRGGLAGGGPAVPRERIVQLGGHGARPRGRGRPAPPSRGPLAAARRSVLSEAGVV